MYGVLFIVNCLACLKQAICRFLHKQTLGYKLLYTISSNVTHGPNSTLKYSLYTFPQETISGEPKCWILSIEEIVNTVLCYTIPTSLIHTFMRLGIISLLQMAFLSRWPTINSFYFSEICRILTLYLSYI